MSKKRMITRLLSVATAVTVGLSFCACGATPEEPKENRREEAEQKDTEKERKDAEKASISLEGEYKPASFEQRDVNSDTIRWMCSAYAIYSAYNDKSLEVVGGLAGDDREWYREEVKEALAGGWGIYDRKDVEDTLEDLLEEGHRKQYKEAVSELKKAEILELSSGEAMVEIAGYDSLSEEEVCKYQTAYEAYQKYGENGIDGWDYCRALQILGDCYQAEYINLEECLDLSLPIAQELQKTYENWDGVAESYLYGYSFWKGERTDDYDSQKRWEVYEELKNMESGPYTVPYDTKLENTWKDGAKAKEKEDKVAVENAPSILDYLDEESQTHFDEVRAMLDSLNIPYVIDTNMVRGLDYYNHTIFEFITNIDKSELTICAGGRYDSLVEYFGGPETAGFGFGLGLERLLLVLDKQGIKLPVEESLDVYIAVLGSGANGKALELVQSIRYQGFKAERDYLGRKIKAQFKSADTFKAKTVITLGESEVESGVVKVKNNATREEVTVSFEELTTNFATVLKQLEK